MADENTNEVRDPQGLLAAYNKAKEDLVELRATNKQLETQLAAVDQDAITKWKERALKAEAKMTLENDGVKNADRILKYISLDGVDFDEEGNLTGLDAKVEEVKTDFPELFDTKRRAGRTGIDATADNPVKPVKDLTDMQVDSWFAVN